MKNYLAFFLVLTLTAAAAHGPLPAPLTVPSDLVRVGLTDSDTIAGGTWEALDRLLKRASYAAGLQKIAAAEAIAAQMIPERNRSRSFQTFRQGLLRIAQSEPARGGPHG